VTADGISRSLLTGDRWSLAATASRRAATLPARSANPPAACAALEPMSATAGCTIPTELMGQLQRLPQLGPSRAQLGLVQWTVADVPPGATGGRLGTLCPAVFEEVTPMDYHVVEIRRLSVPPKTHK
jgi:hypothetical protein